jgi:DNA-binding NarL/FixJ family response regulator
MISLIIVDDHRLFREGISSLLAADEDLEIIGEASSGENLLEMLTHNKPDVVLMDITLPGINGLETIKSAHKLYPKIKFIVITMHSEGQYVVSAVKSGAHGYLLKNADEEELKNAIHAVYENRKYFNKEISALMIDTMAITSSVKQLSPREIEVIRLVAEGKTTKEIAEELIVSTRTVETHRINMMKKLDVQNTAELIRKASELGLL